MRIRNFSDFDSMNENAQGGGNKFILVRFGTTLVPAVSKYFNEIAVKNPKPQLMKAEGSFVTMFETSLTKEALIQGFDGLGITYNLYQIVHTSGGSAGPSLVARKPNKAQLEALLKKAVETENWEEAARLRDQLAELTGTPTPVGGPTESKVFTFTSFEMIKEEEEFVNGTNTEEFNKLVSQLVDHELTELAAGEEESGINTELVQKIKDYLVQNNLYVASEEKPEEPKDDKEEPKQPEGE